MKKWIKANLFIIVFLLLFLGMTIGYALYSEPLSLNGNLTIQKAGRIEITSASIVREECSNLTTYEDPTYSGMHIEFRFDTRSATFSATYLITVTNNSLYDYTYTGFPINAAIEGREEVPIVTSTITKADTGAPLENGEVIKKGESLTMKLKMDFSLERGGSMTIIANGDISSSIDNSGSITASVTPTEGSLKGKETLAPFTLNVINTYGYRRTLNLTSSNENILIVDQNKTPLSSVTISANQTTNFPIYLMVKEGSIFLTETTTTNILVSSSGMDTIDAGELTLEVDVDINATDHEKPEVGNISISISESNPVEGQAIISWTRMDTGGSPITNYHLSLYNETTGETTEYNTFNAVTSYTISNLSPGTYHVTIYGEDEAGNTGMEDCGSASTSSGYCSRSSSTALQWVFEVTTDLSNLTASGSDTAYIYKNYETTLSVRNGWFGGYSLPNNVTITMNNQQLISGTDYTYDSSSGLIVINKVTGDINIRASAANNACLVKGTKVMLADGTEKNIEDIQYDDLLMVYDHENGGVTYEYPIWIEKPKEATYYLETTFSDGSILKTYGPHSVFSKDTMSFISTADTENFHIGANIIKINAQGEKQVVTITEIKTMKENITYYHVSSTRYHNILANNFLTTDGTIVTTYLYDFTENLTWGQKRTDYLATKDFFTYEELKDVFPKYLYDGYRMAEGKNVYNHGLLDISYIGELLDLSNTVPLMKNDDGNVVWMVTTSDDEVTEENKQNYLKEYESEYILPKPKKEENFIGWLNTGDNKLYQPGEKIKVVHGLHFIAKYKE